MRRRYILSLLFLITCPFLQAQDETPEELYNDAEYFYIREEYQEAVYLYRQVLKAEPSNMNVSFLIGMSYLSIPGREKEAIPYLKEASRYITYYYKKHKYTERYAPAHVLFYLGNAYLIDNQLDKAIESYNSFRETRNFEKNYNLKIVEDAIKSAERAKIIQDAPLDLYSYCFEEPINSTGPDFDAVISADEKVMVWVQSQKFYDAIMMCVKQDGKWSVPVNITPQVGSDGDMVPSGLSADGKELYLIKNNKVDKDVYYSVYDGSLWSIAIPLPGDVNSNFNEDFASVTADGNKMYFSSDRPGGVGGLDIYVSDRLDNGKWSKAVALPDLINTEMDETCPYFSPDGQRFYFSSKGHFNMGGYDIFYCKVKDDHSFSLPANIGYPINTTGDNKWFIPLKDGYTGLYSKYSDDGVGKEDIWMIEIVPFKNMVARALTRLSEENFTIKLTGDNGEKITLTYDSVKDLVTVKSDSGIHYKVEYSKEE